MPAHLDAVEWGRPPDSNNTSSTGWARLPTCELYKMPHGLLAGSS